MGWFRETSYIAVSRFVILKSRSPVCDRICDRYAIRSQTSVGRICVMMVNLAAIEIISPMYFLVSEHLPDWWTGIGVLWPNYQAKTDRILPKLTGMCRQWSHHLQQVIYTGLKESPLHCKKYLKFCWCFPISSGWEKWHCFSSSCAHIIYVMHKLC